MNQKELIDTIGKYKAEPVLTNTDNKKTGLRNLNKKN